MLRLRNFPILISLSLGLLFTVNCTKSSITEYDNNVIDLGLGFVAKQMCSCLFVVGQDEEFCRDFVKIRQLSPKIQIENQLVKTSFLFFFQRRAQYQGLQLGCTLL